LGRWLLAIRANPAYKLLCAALDSPPTEPDMRGYAAIVGVFRQKREFLHRGARCVRGR
jgi:hypothetical protein